jgi:hypothetical protein
MQVWSTSGVTLSISRCHSVCQEPHYQVQDPDTQTPKVCSSHLVTHPTSWIYSIRYTNEGTSSADSDTGRYVIITKSECIPNILWYSYGDREVTHSHSHTQLQSHSHPQLQSQSQSHKVTHCHTHSYSHTVTHSCSHTQSLSPTQSQSHTFTQSHTVTVTHSHTFRDAACVSVTYRCSESWRTLPRASLDGVERESNSASSVVAVTKDLYGFRPVRIISLLWSDLMTLIQVYMPKGAQWDRLATKGLNGNGCGLFK